MSAPRTTARNKNQRLAIETAMAILRRSRFTQYDIRWMHEPTRNAIRSAMGQRNETILARIAVAFPGLPIELEGGRLHSRTWVLRQATEVVIQAIQDICGVNPVWGERYDDDWMFLGRTLCTDADRPSIVQPNLIVDDAELVDLFATVDGTLLAVCGFTLYGPTGVDDVMHGGLGCRNPYLREAARRFRIVQTVPVH